MRLVVCVNKLYPGEGSITIHRVMCSCGEPPAWVTMIRVPGDVGGDEISDTVEIVRERLASQGVAYVQPIVAQCVELGWLHELYLAERSSDPT